MPVIRPMRCSDVEAALELDVVDRSTTSPAHGRAAGAAAARTCRWRRAALRASVAHRPRRRLGGRGRAGARRPARSAIRREGIWGLSLLIVRPGPAVHRRRPRILARAHDYAHGARGRIILASPDPRAMRAYSRLGLDRTRATAPGRPARRRRAARGSGEGGASDIPFTEAVDRHVRGAAHGSDIETLLEMGQHAARLPERGYAVVRATARCDCWPPTTRPPRRRCCAAALARVDGETRSNWHHRAPAVGDRVVPRGAGSTSRSPGRRVPGGDVGAVRARTCRAAPSCDHLDSFGAQTTSP